MSLSSRKYDLIIFASFTVGNFEFSVIIFIRGEGILQLTTLGSQQQSLINIKVKYIPF
jgi:hypothetical protein